jgi:hypothetical protein
MVKCIEQFLLLKRFETLYTLLLLQQFDLTVYSNFRALYLFQSKLLIQ